MVGNKLNQLKLEIQKYLGLPYFINRGKYQNHGPNPYVGKGSAQEIALETIELANKEGIKLLELSEPQIYFFQKKHRLGIDCSGLACHLLNFYHQLQINPRRTSAHQLTSSPISKEIKITQVKTGDLIRQKDGRHVLFVIDKTSSTIFYVDSSRHRRGVRLGEYQLTDTKFQHNGFFRINKNYFSSNNSR